MNLTDSEREIVYWGEALFGKDGVLNLPRIFGE